MSDRFGSIAINSDKQTPAPKKTEPPPRRPGPSKKKEKKHGKVLFFPLVACLLLVIYFLAGAYLAPALLKKHLPRYLHETTDLDFTIESIQLNPLNFQLTFKNIQTNLPQTSASARLLQVDSLFMDMDFTSLLRNGFVCDSLIVQGLQLNLTRFKDNSYNIPALFHFSNKKTQEEIMDFAALPFLFSLNNIDISDSRIRFNDLLTGKTHSVDNLHLAIPSFSNFSFQSTNYIQPHFSAIINGSPIQLSGEAVQTTNEQGFVTTLSCTIQDLDLVPYFSYLPSSFPLTLSRGRADTSLQIFFSPKQKQGSRLSIDITMTASNLELQCKNDKLRIKAPALKLEGSLEPLTKRLHIRSIVAKEAQVTGHKNHMAASIQELLPHPSSKTSPQYHLAMDLALIDQGSLTLLDEQKTGSTEKTWKSLQLSIKNFKTAEWNGRKQGNTSGNFRLSGEQDKEKGSFSWQGTIGGAGKLHGKLLLNEFPAERLLDILSPGPAEEIKGSATVTGDLTLLPWLKESPDYTLTNGTLQTYSLELTEDKKTWLEAKSVRFTDLERTEKGLQLGNIFLKGATVSLNSDGTLPSLFSRFSPEEPSRVQLKGIDFSGTLNILAPKGSSPDLQISDIHFQANNLDSTPSKDTPSPQENFALSAHLPKDGLLKAKGRIAVAPLQVQASLAFSTIDNSVLSPFFPRQPLLINSKTTLHGKGLYRYPEPSFQGNLRLTDTVLQNSPKSPLLSWERAELSHVGCQFSPFHLTAETLSLDSPQLQWLRKQDDDDPFQQMEKGVKTLLRKKNEQKDSVEEEELFSVALKEIRFQNGTLHYLDQRLSPPWSITTEKLEGRLKNINPSEPGLFSPFSLTTTLNNAPFSLSGAVTLFPKENTEGRAKLQLTDFPVASFHEQLTPLSINPDSATLTMHVNMSKEPSLFTTKATMLINDLTPTTTDSDTALTLALLKNADGTFPITVHIQNSNRSLFKESMNSFQTTVIKAGYDPLLLDPEFADLQDNNTVAFQPGSTKIDPSNQETLRRYVKLLAKHPQLGLSITGMADRENDHKMLLKSLEEKEQLRVDQENIKRKAEYRERQQVFLPLSPNQTLHEEDIAQEDLAGFKPSLPNPVSVSNEELLNLARERGLLIYNFFSRSLVHGFFTRALAIPSQRIVLHEKEEIVETGPGNRVLLTLKAIPPVAQE